MFSGADVVEQAITDIAAGRAVVVVDDENRENEGDLVFAAAGATPTLVAFAVRHTSGYLCVALPGEECDRLGLPLMCPDGGDGFGTAFTVTVDAARGVSTGISAKDRSHTLRTLADPGTSRNDLVRPGHVLPLRARDGGVLTRAGHTEAAVDLTMLAGVRPAAALCEIVSTLRPGEMARRDELAAFATEHDLTLVTIADIAAYRRRTEPQVARAAAARLPTRFGTFTAHGYVSVADGAEHLALIPAGGTVADASAPTPAAVHVECISGDVLGSRACRCGAGLSSALGAVAREGTGVVVYLRASGSTECPTAPTASPGPSAVPSYLIAAHILADLGVGTIRLLDARARPDELAALEGQGISVVPVTAGNVRRLPTAPRRAPAAPYRTSAAAVTGSGG